MRDAVDVRVDRNALHHAKDVVHDDVGRLAAHAGQLLQALVGVRHLAVEVDHDHAGAVDAVAGLVAEEADAADDVFDLLNGRLRHGGGSAGNAV